MKKETEEIYSEKTIKRENEKSPVRVSIRQEDSQGERERDTQTDIYIYI